MFSKFQKSQFNCSDSNNAIHSKKVKFSRETARNSPFHSNSSSEKKIPKHPDSNKKLLKNQLNYKENITLKDLCVEDKAKIGELVKKFADEKREKEELLQKLEEKQKFFEESMKEIRKENEQVAMESIELKEKFKHSINLLKNLQNNSDQNKENRQIQEKNIHLQSPFKKKIGFQVTETEKNLFFDKKSPIKENYLVPLSFSPKREILKFEAGETERKLLSLEKNRKKQQESYVFQIEQLKKTAEINNNMQKNLDENEKTVSEIDKLKEEIDELAISLKKLQLSSPDKTKESPKKLEKDIKMVKNGGYFQNLSKLNENQGKNIKYEKKLENEEISRNSMKNIMKYDESNEKRKENQRNQAINIVDNEIEAGLDSEEEDELDEDIEIAKKWLDSKKKKFKEFHEKTKEINEIEDLNMFSQKNLSNLRVYLDKKLDDFSQKPDIHENMNKSQQKSNKKQSISNIKTDKLPENHNFIRDDLSTPKPQRIPEEPMQYKQPSFIENSQIYSEKSNKSKQKEDMRELVKESLEREIKNSLNKINFNEVLEEKIKEFLYINDRVLNDNSKIGKILGNSQKIEKNEKNQKNQKNIKNEKIQKNEKNEKFEEIHEENSKYDEENHENYDKERKTFSFTNKNSVAEENITEISKRNLNFYNNPQENHINFKEKQEKPSKLKNFDFFSKKPNLSSSIKPSAEQEEINELLNYNDDFYENGLFDLIDEIDQQEFIRTQDKNHKNPKIFSNMQENFEPINNNTSSLEEIIEENRIMNSNTSYTETDASIRYIKKQIKEMEDSKRKNIKK